MNVRAWWERRVSRMNDQGDTSIQMAIIFPFVLMATLAVVQASMWFFARQIALTAAREGVAAARTYESGPGQGAGRAREVLDRIAGDSLMSPQVSTAGSNAQRVRVEVSGTAQSMIPGISGLRVSQSASGAVERWTTPGE